MSERRPRIVERRYAAEVNPEPLIQALLFLLERARQQDGLVTAEQRNGHVTGESGGSRKTSRPTRRGPKGA